MALPLGLAFKPLIEQRSDLIGFVAVVGVRHASFGVDQPVLRVGRRVKGQLLKPLRMHGPGCVKENREFNTKLVAKSAKVGFAVGG